MAGGEYEQWIKEIAELAADIVVLPVNRQYQVLAQHGFTLGETNWENWKTNPGKETIIPIQRG